LDEKGRDGEEKRRIGGGEEIRLAEEGRGGEEKRR
jgi:hypothetical protein